MTANSTAASGVSATASDVSGKVSLVNSLRVRLLAPVTALLLVVFLAATAVLANIESSRIQDQANDTIALQAASIQNMLSVAKSIMLDRVGDSMRLLKSRGESLGAPRVGGQAQVADKHVNDVVLGNKPQANNFELVDGVTDIMSGTATIFTRTSDNNYVRVSTNVKNYDGTRATGTMLDPNGLAIAQIRKNKPFYGVVDILGNPYVTGYEPIFDDNDNVIGIWYVGYQTDLKPLESVISNSRALDTGFFALYDATNKLRFSSKTGADEATINKVVQADNDADWVIKKEQVPGWGFTLVSAYPKSDISKVTTYHSAMLILFGFLAFLLVLGLQLSLLWSRVLRPVQRLTDAAIGLSMGRYGAPIAETSLRDEIGVLARSIERLSNSVRLAMERLAKRRSSDAS